MLSSPIQKTKQIERQSMNSPNKQYTLFENQKALVPIYMNRQFNTGSINVWVSEKIFYIQPKSETTGISTVLKINRQTQKVEELVRQEYLYDRNKQQALHRQQMLQKQKRYKEMQVLHYSILIGIVNLSETSSSQSQKPAPKKILFLAQTVQLVCTINLRNIYKILKPMYIFFNPKDKDSLNEEEAALLYNLNVYFEQGMYYSYTYDLSKTMKADIQKKKESVQQKQQNEQQQQQQQQQSSKDDSDDEQSKVNENNKKFKKKEFEKRCSLGAGRRMRNFQEQNVRESKQYQGNRNKRMSTQQQGLLNGEIDRQTQQFNWAEHLQRQLESFNQKWRIPIIQGYVNKIQVYVNAQKFKLVLISRRSRLNGGPLKFSTGFTTQFPHPRSHPSPANEVETQLIFHIKKYYYSFTQIRGTVPLYWKYKYGYGMVSGVQFQRTIEENYRGFIQYYNFVRNKCEYERFGFVNLLETKNSVQSKLIQNFQYIIKKCQNLPGLSYTYFDLHSKCPQKNFTNLTQFLNTQLKLLLKKCSFSVFELQNQYAPLQKFAKPRLLTQLHTQKGILRTNCATCIDRTNIFQSRVSAYQIISILQTLDLKINGLSQNLHYIEDQSAFARLYRNMWADNADAISQQYSGTNSMESVTVRMGKMSYLSSIDHGLTSLYRIVRNLRDQDKGKLKAMAYLSLGRSDQNLGKFQKEQKTQTSRSSEKLM